MKTTIMTETERKEKARRLFEKLEEHMGDLYCRWQDEREYEDIKEYSVQIERHVAEIGGHFVKMSKRPFGFTYKLADATYQVTMGSRRYEYKRIA